MTHASLFESAENSRIPGSLCFDITPANGDKAFRIFISPPRGTAPPGGWPVLYLVDGNACFPIAAAAHAIQSPYPQGTNVTPGILVAIGYPTDEPFDLERRAWDLTPPPGRAYPPYRQGDADIATGGAERFLRFINNDLKPLIASQFAIDTNRQSLFGHSFGGLFALYCLFTQPQSFSRYIAASPSIFWEDCCILGFEERFSAKSQPESRVLHLSAGEFEADRLAPFQETAADSAQRQKALREARTAFHAEHMARRLADCEAANLLTKYETFPGETHLSVLPPAIGRALQVAFSVPTT